MSRVKILWQAGQLLAIVLLGYMAVLLASPGAYAATPSESGAGGLQRDPPSFAYLLHCAGCHLENGSGDPPDIPDMRTDLGRFLNIAEGRDYVLRVPGVADAPIPPDEMAELLNWMINQFYPDHETFEPYTPEEVQVGRANRLHDPVTYRRDILMKLTAGE